ncbi:MAG: phosphatidate cytidylyltransferase [Myxococcota bacterium]|jgi:phosphatidate cytidylyltransferase
MSSRIVTGLLLAAGAILLLTLAPPVWTMLLIQLAAIGVADEFCRITMGADRWRERIAGMIAVGLFPAVSWWAPEYLLLLAVSVPPLLLTSVLFSNATVQEMGTRAGYLVAGASYLGFAVAALTLIVASKGSVFVLAIIAAISAGDSGAFFAGKAFGKTPLYPKISPKKTREGSLGGAFASVLGVVLVNWFGDLGIPLVHQIGLGLGAGISGAVGDLAESLFKRAFGVKDSGTLLPGHGGVWDRIDGVLFAAPFAFVYLGLTGI